MSTAPRVDIGTFIVADPSVRGGRPCIAGTGMSVHAIAARYGRGMEPNEIADQFPEVPRSHILAAIAYYLANREEVDGYLAEDAALFEAAAALSSLARMLTGCNHTA